MQLVEHTLRDEQVDAARERFAVRADERKRKIELLERPGGIALADDPDRVQKRAQRLSRYYGDIELGRAALEPTAENVGMRLEKIIGTKDLVPVSYLAEGAQAARAVCKVNIRDAGGRALGSGSGSMVSPRLLLTNHHVLPSAAVARSSRAEFDFEDDIDGQSRQSRSFALDPDSFFVANKARDFALVAVGGADSDLATYGYNPMIGAEGKAIVGDYVAIVQHPGGDKKMVALRENRVVDLDGSFIHYEADTEPGSSGSPVFSKEWELVGLHHASVPAPGHAELGGFMNEGIRISRIMKFLREEQAGMADRARQLFRQLERAPAAPPALVQPATFATASGDGTAQPVAVAADGATVQLLVPLEISVRVGTPTPGAAAAALPPSPPPPPPAPAPAPVEAVAHTNGSVQVEKIEIDPDYDNRKGYDPAFLGTGKFRVPLPTLATELKQKAAKPLAYHHFSVVMNTERRLAFFTGVNIDGARDDDPAREPDRWVIDKRLPDAQTGEEAYAKNPLDRGHLVRRIDPAWGDTAKERKYANDDTFHFTNCAPQHEDFNQNKSTWAGLEDYILRNAQTRDFRATVFSGPVFRDDDDDFRGLVKLPREYWKVAVMRKKSGELSATGYLLSQAELIAGLEVDADFSYGAYKTFQVPVSRVESVTGLDFGKLGAADPLAGAGQEAASPPAVIAGPSDVRL